MPRRRRTMRTPKMKMPKATKIPRPKTKDLRILYKGLLSVSGGNRISTLAYALQWYDSALPYLIQKKLLSVDARPKLDKAVKCRKQGIGTTNLHEKESSFRMAIRLYEAAAAALKPVSVDESYKKFDEMKDHLEQRQKKMEEKYGQVIGMLQKAVGNRFKFELADAQKPVQWNPELTTLTYNSEAAKVLALQLREQGFLPVFLEQLDYLVRHACLEPDPDPSKQGGWVYYPAKHVEIMNDLLKEFVKFAQSPEAPKRLVKDGAPRPLPAQGSHATGAPRGPRPGLRGVKVDGLWFTLGTDQDIVYKRLLNQQVWNLRPDLLGDIKFSNPIWLVRRLLRYGKKTGAWEVKLTKTTAQLILSEQWKAQQAQAQVGVQP
jgi:hypothetical protein